MLTDSQELAVTTDSLRAVNAINDFFEQLFSVGNKGQSILEVVKADPTCAMPYCKPSRARTPSGKQATHDCISPSEKTTEIANANAHVAAFYLFSGTGNVVARSGNSVYQDWQSKPKACQRTRTAIYSNY
ncbi:MAG: hypothetical protein PUP92_20055 [Rhizonema sp. PD38]|nr:hypothetical protein [Rhizonema sp. PD38]